MVQQPSSADNPIIMSFCIPTYNRAEIVYECVTNILKYPGDEIEVVVSDNASPDNTKKLLDTITDPRFRYSRNETNIRLQNYKKALSLGKGCFCVIMSDEDDIVIENIPYYVNVIKQNMSAGVLMASSNNPDGSPSNALSSNIYPAGIKTLKKFRFNLLYCSGAVYNRSKLNMELDDQFYAQTVLATYNYYHYDTVTVDKALLISSVRDGYKDKIAFTEREEYYYEVNPRINTSLPMMINLYKGLPLSAYEFDFMAAYAVRDIVGLLVSVYNKKIGFVSSGTHVSNIKDYSYFKVKKRLYKKLGQIAEWDSPAKQKFHILVIRLLYWPLATRAYLIEFLARNVSSDVKTKIKKILHLHYISR